MDTRWDRLVAWLQKPWTFPLAILYLVSPFIAWTLPGPWRFVALVGLGVLFLAGAIALFWPERKPSG